MKTIFKRYGIFLLFILALNSCDTQQSNSNAIIIDSTPQKQEVLDAIVRFHDGMRQKNGELAISAWEKMAAGYSISIDSLGNSVKNIDDPVDEGKLERIRKWLDETTDDLDEEIFDVRVNFDGELASAWVPYNFYRNAEFSHSGSNAFTLMKFGNDWKIISVADTRYFGKRIHD